MIIDGCLQTFWGLESSNLRKAITDGIFGLALGFLVSKIYSYIDRKV